MANALIEDPRITLYRQKLAVLLRRTSCRWISFAVGTAPIHRTFFENVAVALEGLPTTRLESSSHRQVQYGVRMRIAAEDGDRAAYDADGDLLVVPAEDAFDTLDGQATLVSACVHLGLDLEGRNRRPLDGECAARIACHLYRLYETVTLDESEHELTHKLQQLMPTTSADKPFFDVAVDIVRHCCATLRANRRSYPVRPGSFMKIVRTDRCERLRDLLLAGAARHDRAARKRARGMPALPRASRYLALQALQPPPLEM
ncbi:MAG TPA: hypothetical protein VMQ73_05375 [Methylomirabilota bacterium]|nr:hypothetical protein [Methylomirabilota bacterium]